ncbi:MAG: hypothetical protein JNK14_01125 [Chitinophagaceae bacterium]|nr:hypothetical protein [Chitinophagaceae bacterium]
MKKICLLLLLSGYMLPHFGQGFNSNHQKSYINIPLPKTPESQSFEKYGAIPIDEYSGTPNITVPLYTVKGRFLEAPLSLAYHASGIKVNQEATWVGLGFDLVCGGRITVETRGNVDDYVRNYTSQQQFKDGLRRLFTKWKVPYNPYPNAPGLGYAYLDYGKLYSLSDPLYHTNDTLWDDNFTVTNAAWFGIAEPDIYYANFDGNSLKFYIDLVDEQVRFIGEKSLFNVAFSRDSAGVAQFTITDNGGKKYFFEQREFTKVAIPPSYGFNSHISSPSAWLLTKVVHPSQDTLWFNYSNYGYTYPAPSWSASISAKISPYTSFSVSSGLPNQVTQTPYYLSQVSSGNTVVNFIMGSREDLRGNGAKKLDKIEVKDKITNTLIREIVFSYDYFTATQEAYEQSLPDSVKNCYKKRLKLLSVKEFNSTDSKPWLFYYKNISGPSKMSFAQDHWGYYNGVDNTAGNPFVSTSDPYRLIPTFSELGSLASRVTGATVIAENNCVRDNGADAPPGTQIHTSFNGIAQGRGCSSTMILAYMMDSIVYPTGGSTKFEFEPHRSSYYDKGISDLLGGGIRMKSVKNYATDNLLQSVTEYDYMNSGVYLGAIEYLRVSNRWPSRGTVTMSSHGIQNLDGQSVGYASVKKIVKDYLNQANSGYTIKYFYANSSLTVQYTNTQFPFQTSSQCNTPYSYTPQLNYLSRIKSGITPMPARNLDGKLYREDVYNSYVVKVKSTEYYYQQADLTNPYFSLQASDNYDGYSGDMGASIVTCDNCCTNTDFGWGSPYYCPSGWRRWEVCLSPAVSFYTVLDSMVEKTLGNNGNFITQKKSFNYNKYHQQEYATLYNSDGTQTIQYTKTPLSFDHPAIPNNGENDAYLIEQLKSAHIYDVPIEQISLNRSITGDSLVSGGVYQVYDLAVLKKVYAVETNVPLVFRTQFVPSYYYHNYPTLPSFNVVIDSKYKLQDSAEYYSSQLVKNVYAIKGKQSFVWDETYNTIMASCVDATASDIAYSSFETNAKGNWSYSGTSVTDVSSPGGTKSYSLSNGSVSKSSLGTKTYVVSYWSKNGAQNVNGSTGVSGRSVGGFTYYEHKVSNPVSGTITVSGSGTIDELRLYPEKSLMNTYVYKPLIGVSSVADPSNRFSYYEYDGMNRMSLVRDQDKNILKRVEYKYQTCPTSFTNAAQSRNFYKSTCGSGYVSSPVTYTIPVGKYTSCVSQTEVDGWMENEFNLNGQAYANDPANGATCSACTGTYAAASGWTSFYTSITPNSNTVSLTLVVAATNSSSFNNINNGVIIGTITSTCCRPSVARSFSCSESGRMWSVTVYPDGQVLLVRTGGAALPSVYQGFTLSGSFSL